MIFYDLAANNDTQVHFILAVKHFSGLYKKLLFECLFSKVIAKYLHLQSLNTLEY